jgi:hypothetical protein
LLIILFIMVSFFVANMAKSLNNTNTSVSISVQ